MQRSIYVNLMVKDLPASMEYFKKLGFTFNEKFSDKTAAALEIAENIGVMLLTEEKMKQFVSKELVDAKKSTEALLAITCESREAVDELFNKAIEAGGKEIRPADDYGFMYSHSFEDLDGHIWGPFWMDESQMK